MLARDDRFLPKLFDRMSIRGVPIYSILLVLVVTIVLVAPGRSLATIIGIMVDGFLLSYAPGAISLMVFRKTDPDTRTPFKLPFAHIFAPIPFIIANILVYWSVFAAVEIIIPLDLGRLFLLIIYNH